MFFVLLSSIFFSILLLSMKGVAKSNILVFKRVIISLKSNWFDGSFLFITYLIVRSLAALESTFASSTSICEEALKGVCLSGQRFLLFLSVMFELLLRKKYAGFI